MYYDEPVGDVLLRLNSSQQGLTSGEALLRLRRFGANVIEKKKQHTAIKIFFEQFKNFLVILLIFAALISFFLGDRLEFYGIIIIILLSATLGFIQEYNAENAMEALKKIGAPNARVLRDKETSEIPAKELVPGDIVILTEGDIIPADLRILEESSLQIDEASLTGESMPVKKTSMQLHTALQLTEQKNMAFAGTVVSYGKGRGVVISTGMNTEFGKIADTIQNIEQTATPLQIKFTKLAEQIGFAIIILVIMVFVMGALSLKPDIVQLFIFSLSLAVAAVPSALPAIVTVSLGLGAKRLAKKNMIIKQMPAAESLGSVTIICTDKTGTITKNQMTITKIMESDRIIDVSGAGYSPSGDFRLADKLINKLDGMELLFRTGYLCNNSKLESSGDGWSIMGDSTEGSLLVLAKKARLDTDSIEEDFTKVKELPFDSDRKLMSMVYKNSKNQKTEAYIKGAPDLVLKLCNKIYINNRIRKISSIDRVKILKNNNLFAEDSLRVLALAYKDVSKLKRFDISDVEKDLVFLGLVGMIDPPREGVAEAVKQCDEAGIRVMMITGDHPMTAKAIAKQIGLYSEGDLILTGEELDRLSDEQLEHQIDNIRIIARALPIQKTRIVHALQNKGHIVAMTGDGVNDAPALKKADIGIAMGISGTDVSKEVAKAILMDDHFATIVNAVAEGRNIYDKILKSTKYLLACNAGEILSVFIAILLRFPLPLIPLQILLMNLLTDGLPAMGLGSEIPESDVMTRHPRNPKENPITGKMLILIIIFGIAMALGTLFVFNKYVGINLSYARTMAFTTLVFFEIFAVMSARSFRSFTKVFPFSNKALTFGILASVMIQLVVIYFAPLQHVFSTVPLQWNDWVLIIAISSLGFILMEFSKVFIKEEYEGVKLYPHGG